MVAEAAATLQPIAEGRQIRLALDPPDAPESPAVSADTARFKQVLYNLLSNAIKFSPVGGTVTVSCTPSADGRHVRTSVTDTGAGITPGDLERLFTPFTQLANAREYGGTGLGLALTRQLVELMGGHIGVESTPGAGSTFFFDLPVDEAPAPAARPAPPQTPSAARLALVVDDDPAARELLTLMLEAGGYRTTVASNGEEAVAAARRLRPDVITLDVLLPTIDGWDVLRILQSDRATSRISVVMVGVSSDHRLGVRHRYGGS